jgi:hypothetical protein
MGFFQNLNREFEGQLVEDIATRLASHHGLQGALGSVKCHQGKGSSHTKLTIPLQSGDLVSFHYCGGMGFALLNEEGDWGHADFMMTTKNSAAQRIVEFIDYLNNSAPFEAPSQQSSSHIPMPMGDEWGLADSIANMAVTKDYFSYSSETENWFEAAIFKVECTGHEFETAMLIHFKKLTPDSTQFEVVLGYYRDGEFTVYNYEPFDEVKDSYIGVAFNIYIETHCLSKILMILNDKEAQLYPEHVKVLEEAVDTLKVDLETALSMKDSIPSFRNSNIPKFIENVYRKFNLKGTFGEDIFPE